MTITYEQVADLREGDVVELKMASGTIIRGPLAPGAWTKMGLEIVDAGWMVRDAQGGIPTNLREIRRDIALTVISRAPRPLYVNHSRTEPVPGDVVRPADGTKSVAFRRIEGWIWPNGTTARLDTYGLRLLVDGETGEAVTS